MSWVLILTSALINRPPAVIGGYPTQLDAEAAGDAAITPGAPTVGIMGRHYPRPDFCNYTVIPGAAVDGPLGSSHCNVRIDWESNGEQVTRTFYRWPEE